MYKRIFQNYLLPLFEDRLKGRKVIRLKNHLNQTQWMEKNQLRAYQVAEFKKLLTVAGSHNPYWKALFKELELNVETIDSMDVIKRLPIMDKSTIQANYNDMLSNDQSLEIWKKATGGSTGSPLHFAYTPESYDWKMAMSKRGYSWAGADDGEKQFFIWGIHLGQISKLSQLKERIYNHIYRKKYFNCFDINEQRHFELASQIASFKPKVILSYTNPLFDFAKFFKNKKIVPYSPQGIISAAEVLHPFQRQTIEEVFRCKVFNTYGSREFMLIGAECDKHNGLHVSSENLYVEILDEQGKPCAAGEEGYIHVTDFHNYAMPFIRYKLGDMGIMSNEPCECGRAHPLLKKVTGRSLDILHLPGGKSLPGEFFPHFFKDYDAVKQFQIYQDEQGSVKVRIVIDSTDTCAYLARIKLELVKNVPELNELTFQVEDSIELTTTGKHRVVVSAFKV